MKDRGELYIYKGFPRGAGGKELAASTGDVRDASSIPGSRRVLGGGHGNPFQYSCLENLMDQGAWWAMVHRAVESDTTEVT